jgi:endonuclease/exonuclease/phosphatase family metal-dependent hydrolase
MLLMRWIMLPALLLSPACANPSSGGRGESTPASSPAPASLRVMSLNVRFGTANDGANGWRHRRDLLVQTIRLFDPDLLGTQEVLAFQATEMRELLPDYGFVGGGRDDGAEEGEMSPVFYRKERFELLDRGRFWLSETPDQPGSQSWDSQLPRIATWVRLLDRKVPVAAGPAKRSTAGNAGELFFLNTHWDHAGVVAQLESAKLIRRRVADSAGGAAIIITGDLNCTEDDEPYAVFRGAGDDSLLLVDSFRAVYPQRLADEATFHGFKGTVSGSRIDFICHTRAYAPLQAAIDRSSDHGRFPSDHYPVTAILRWAH